VNSRLTESLAIDDNGECRDDVVCRSSTLLRYLVVNVAPKWRSYSDPDIPHPHVIPANAGIHFVFLLWIPAFAGMTRACRDDVVCRSGTLPRYLVVNVAPKWRSYSDPDIPHPHVIPANAGIHCVFLFFVDHYSQGSRVLIPFVRG
jgi:hypothetical protein